MHAATTLEHQGHQRVLCEPAKGIRAPRSSSFLRFVIAAFAITALVGFAPAPAAAQGHPQLEANARAALGAVEAQVPLAKILKNYAVAILVFPDITKAGFLIGGEYGNGVMFQGGRVTGYYNTAGVSYGLQAGAETFGYAMYFMNQAALQSLNSTDGFQIGAGPSVVVLDEGMAKTLTSSTLTQDIYAFVFSQQGLMGGMGLDGTKITRLNY